MTVKKAVDILQRQKNKIDDPQHHNDDIWVSQTASYIKDFFGFESIEYSYIAQFRFSIVSSGLDSKESINHRLNNKPILAKKFINSCIETLKDKGLFEKPKQNFLNRLSDTAIWTIIAVGIPGLLSIGLFFGNIYSDKQNIELRQENKLLKDRLTKFEVRTDEIINERSDTIIHKQYPP